MMILRGAFQISGMVIAILVLLLYLTNNNKRINREISYFQLICVVIFSIAIDFISVAVLLNLKGPMPLYIEIICKVHLCGVVLLSQSIFSYILDKTHKNKKIIDKIRLLHFLVAAVGMLILAFSSIEYYNQDFKIFTYGNAVYITYGLVFITLFMIISVIFSGKDKINFKEKISLYVVVGFFILALFIQGTRNEILIIGFLQAVALIYIYIQLENPRENVEHITGCFHMHIFTQYKEARQVRNKKYYVFAFSINERKATRDAIGNNKMNKILYEMAAYLRGLKGATVFKGNDPEFLIAFDYEEELDYALKSIRLRLNQTWQIEDMYIKLSIKLVYIRDVNIISPNKSVLETLIFFLNQEESRGKNKFTEINLREYDKMKQEDVAENSVREAIENGTVDVFYQPIYDVNQKKFTSAEALMRIKDKKGRFIPPDLFIPIAEKNGLILELGEIVFESVCKFISEEELVEQGIENIDINLSVIQCMQETLADELIEIMNKHNINFNSINLELTESAAISSEITLLDNMNKLISNKVEFALDDYGKGYANLAYIMDFPFTVVKLDKSMISAIEKNKKALLALEQTIIMLHNMELKIVAEGVETKGQLEILEQVKVDYIQGFYFSRPIPREEFLFFIKNNNKL